MAKGVNYQFNKQADEKLRAGMFPQFGAEPGGGVVREGPFMARRDEQIRLRKLKERRAKIAAIRAKA